MNSVQKDRLILASGFISLVKLALFQFGITIEQEALDAVVNVLAIAVSAYVGWKNTYTTKESQIQRKVLKEYRLIK